MNDKQGGNIVVVGLLSLLLVLSLAFGSWAYAGRQDYKKNVDAKIARAVQIEVEKAKTTKDTEFAQKEKEPLKTYTGPDSLGGISVSYPKTWSAYIDEAASGNIPIKAYFHPNFVPATGSNAAYALRLDLRNTAYDQVLKQFDGPIQNGKVSSQPYRLNKVGDVLGVKLTGEIDSKHQGVMVMLPLRDKTLLVWTESADLVNDFNNFILPNLSFRP